MASIGWREYQAFGKWSTWNTTAVFQEDKEAFIFQKGLKVVEQHSQPTPYGPQGAVLYYLLQRADLYGSLRVSGKCLWSFSHRTNWVSFCMRWEVQALFAFCWHLPKRSSLSPAGDSRTARPDRAPLIHSFHLIKCVGVGGWDHTQLGRIIRFGRRKRFTKWYHIIPT